MLFKKCNKNEVKPFYFDLPEPLDFELLLCFDCRNNIFPQYLIIDNINDESRKNGINQQIKFTKLWQKKYL